MKNKIKILLCSLLLGSLSSCVQLPYRPTYPIDLENVTYNLVDPRGKHVTSSKYSNLNPSCTVIPSSFSHLDYGFVTVQAVNDGGFGTYSFMTGQIAVPVEYTSLEYLNQGNAGVYVKGYCKAPTGTSYTSDTQICDLYDYRGGVVAKGFLNKKYALNTWTYEDLNGNVVLLERFSDGNRAKTVRVNADGSRSAVADRCWTLVEDPEGDRIPFASSLNDLGLPEYWGTLSSSSWLSVYRNGSKIDIYIPDRMDQHAFFWKCLFYQNQLLVSGEEYDYIQDGKKYKLSTMRIPLVSGRIENVSFPYYIDELTPLYSDDHVTHYAKAVVRKIINGKLDDYLSVFIINNEGTVLADVTTQPIYFKGTEILDGEHFITADHLSLVNSDFGKTKALISAPKQIAYDNDCLSVEQSDGTLSLLNFSGETRFEGAYRYARIDSLYDGCGFAEKNDGTYYTLDIAHKKETPLSLNSGFHFEDIGYGFLRMRKGDVSYYRSYDWQYNPDDPETGTIITTGLGSNLFNHWTVDVTKDNSGYPYAYRCFFSD